MELKTKYNINDEVWFVHPQSQRAVCGKVMGIRLEVRGQPKYKAGERRNLIMTGEYEARQYYPTYTMDDNIRKEGVTKSETEIFETKELLVNSIKEKADKL